MGLCNITGIVADSGNEPLDGVLRVTLDATLVDDSQSPDVVLAKTPHEFAITNGVIDISLPESDTSQITYRFEFVPDGETLASIDFRARVPNVADIDFSQLVPTGLTTDSLDTGIRRLAQVITQTPEYAQALRGLNFLGTYSALTLYSPNDVVNNGGFTWVWYNPAPGLGQTPAEPSDYWQKLSLVA